MFPVLTTFDQTGLFIIIVLITVAFLATSMAMLASNDAFWWNRVNLPLFIIGATMSLASFIAGESIKGSSTPLVNAATLGGSIIGLVLIFAIMGHACLQAAKEDQKREKEREERQERMRKQHEEILHNLANPRR